MERPTFQGMRDACEAVLAELDAELVREERDFAERVADLRARQKRARLELRVARQAAAKVDRLFGKLRPEGAARHVPAGVARGRAGGTVRAGSEGRERVHAFLVDQGRVVGTGEIERAVKLSNPVVTLHLKRLVAEGRVERVKRGNWRAVSDA